VSPEAELRDLRRQVRVWRRGRADTSLGEALSDAYVAVFSTAVLASMLVSVVVNLRRVAGQDCPPGGACSDARAALPWLTGVAAVAGVLAVSRLLGPMLVTPAVATWLLPTPVDRAALLRPRLVGTGAVALAAGALLAAGAGTLTGFTAAEVAGYAGAVAAACLLVVALATLSQSRRDRRAQVLTWVFLLLLWALLVAVTVDAVPGAASAPHQGSGWGAAAGVVSLLAVGAGLLAHRELPRLGRHRLTPGGALVPGLSGALAGLDLALVYDVLVARHWTSRSTVRSVRGRGTGAGALVWREVVRLRRTPQVLVALAGLLVVPYLGATVGLGRVDLLAAAATGFLGGLGLFSSLRVLSRTPSLMRCLPMPPVTVRLASLSVPATVLVLWSLGTLPALRSAVDAPALEVVPLALAVGVTSATAVVRWVSGRPPDYQLPLVTSPLGAVPTSTFVSVLRGPDVLLLGTAPLLVSPTGTGALVALALDAVVLVVLVNRA
jgi:hypothetical protein